MSARTYRARPAPRRAARSGGEPFSRIDWERAGRVALVAVLFLILAWYVRPTVRLIGQWQAARHDRAHFQALQAENAHLRRRTAEVRRPDVLEREARKIGMVRQGERAYVIRGLGPAARRAAGH